MARYAKSTTGKGAAVNSTMARYAKNTTGKGAAVNSTMAKIENEELSARRISGKQAVANAIMTRENIKIMALK
jgi:hypothetical protein